MSSILKKIIMLLVALLTSFIIVGAIYLVKVNNYKNRVSSINIHDIKFISLKDGTYNGEYSVDFIRAKVSLTVKNSSVIKIELVEHYNDKGSAAEKIIDDIVKKQSLIIDNIAGATNSSKVIKKAVENAAQKAM